MLDKLFREHPRSVGETHFEHLRFAGGFGVQMVVGGLACLVHAIVPVLFTSTGSAAIAKLGERLGAECSNATFRPPHGEPAGPET